jgi:hypothetical protein
MQVGQSGEWHGEGKLKKRMQVGQSVCSVFPYFNLMDAI